MQSAKLQIYHPGEGFRAGEHRQESLALPVETKGDRPVPGNRDYIRKCRFGKELAGPGRVIPVSLSSDLKENPF